MANRQEQRRNVENQAKQKPQSKIIRTEQKSRAVRNGKSKT